jgi:hypothetical protein
MNPARAKSIICGTQGRPAPVMEQVLSCWSGDLTYELPEEIRKHLLGCCHCLRLWIALEAAAELASLNGRGMNSSA